MFDHKTMTYNGEHVSYATMPMYMLSEINQHADLTPAAKLVFMLLMAYASAANSCQFKITNKWVEDRTALSDKTVSRALAQLRKHGYVNDNGIVFGEPSAKQRRVPAGNRAAGTRNQQATPHGDARVTQTTLSATTTPVPSVQVNHFPDATKMVDDTDVNAQANAMLASLGIRKKVVISGAKTPDILSNGGTFVQTKTDKKSAHIITIPNNTLLKNTPTASSDKPAPKKQPVQNEPSGLFSSPSASGFVENTKPKPLASFIPTLGKNQTVAIGKPASLSPQHTSYIATALTRMNVTSPSERKRYLDEIAYAATQGAFSETYRHTPLKAIRACLNLVEAGKWRANGGMY